jgi:UDP-N-acetylglucosamine 2-epimerase
MPEEQNRILTDHISDMLLCPTQTAVDNLKKEGVTAGVVNTGDIMYDTVLRNIGIANEKYSNGLWFDEIVRENGNITKFTENGYYLATVHRAENTDNPDKLSNIFKAFSELDKPVLLPLHPRTKKLIENLGFKPVNITIIKPVGYLLMLYLTSNAYMVVTDSGGLQKEAYFLNTPCTTLRDQTEWIETLENAWNVLSQIDVEEIKTKVRRELTCLQHPQPKSFGEGNAALKICDAIINGGKINE